MLQNPTTPRRLLIVSDSPALFTGQARVVRELAARFHRAGVEVVVAGWFHHLMSGAASTPYRVVPALKEYPETLEPILQAVQPDTVLAIGDPWDFQWLAARRARGREFELVGYLNIEGEPIPPHLEVVLDGFDLLATSSEYGARVIGRPGVVPIHYGVDRTVFYPRVKQPEFQGRDLAKTFVVFINAQNTYRKNIASALAGFARFAEGKTDVLCYANTTIIPTPGHGGQNLEAIVIEHDLARLVCFAKGNNGPTDTVDDEEMNAMYGLADVLLVTSTSEGFGLPVLEAMATGTVPIAPRAYSMPELLLSLTSCTIPAWQYVGYTGRAYAQHVSPGSPARGELIPIGATLVSNLGLRHSFVSIEAIADALERTYASWKDGSIERTRRAGMAFALSRPWDRTYELLCDAMAQPRARRAADGQQIDAYLRQKARRASQRHPGAVGVLKLGGLGDMLQTTVVVCAAAAQYDRPIVIFCDGHGEVFESMPEVAEVVTIRPAVQDTVVRSIADAFEVFLDVRYVSRGYGACLQPTDFAVRHRWFYENWAGSCSRLADLKLHATEIMLRSLGLVDRTDDPLAIRPIFTPREDGRAFPGPYVAVATGAGALGALKLWPRERWETLAADLDDQGVTLVQVGGVDDLPVPGAMDCRGESLARTATILELAECLVAVENGMVHLAAAVGTRSVVIFGPTPSVLFGYPGNDNLAGAACTPCFWSVPTWPSGVCAIGEPSCMNFPDESLVYCAVMNALGRSGSTPPALTFASSRSIMLDDVRKARGLIDRAHPLDASVTA